MNFDEWYEREGRVMTEGGCSQEIVARAAYFIATNNEREACAKVCEGRIGGAVQSDEWWSGFKAAMGQCAKIIRARSNA